MNIKKVLEYVLWLWHPMEGAMTIWFLAISPVISVLWFSGYMLYEVQEYKEQPDTCAIDIRDFLIGFGIAAMYELVNGRL